MRIVCLPGGPLLANTYVIVSDDNASAVIVDPTDSSHLEAFLERENLSPIAILLTHGHFDHTSGLPAFLSRYPIPVYLHPGDAPMLTNPEHSGLHLFFPNADFIPLNEFVEISDGQMLKLKTLSCTVLSTPGHSKGSVCYLIDDCLFSGDTLFRRGFGRTDLWGGNGMELSASLRRLSALDPQITVYPGHGESTTIAHEFTRRIR